MICDLLNGFLAQDVTCRLNRARLVAIPKGDGGVRPVAMGQRSPQDHKREQYSVEEISSHEECDITGHPKMRWYDQRNKYANVWNPNSLVRLYPQQRIAGHESGNQRGNTRNMGHLNMEYEGTPDFGHVVPQIAAHGPGCGPVYHTNTYHHSNQIGIPATFDFGTPPTAQTYNSDRNVFEGIGQAWGGYPSETSSADESSSYRTAYTDHVKGDGCGNAFSVQNGFAGWRGLQSCGSRFCGQNSEQNSYQLGCENQDYQRAAFSSGQHGCYRRPEYDPYLQPCEEYKIEPENQYTYNHQYFPFPQTSHGSPVHIPFPQTWSHHQSNAPRSYGAPVPRTSHEALSSQAGGNTFEIRGAQRSDGTCTRNSKYHAKTINKPNNLMNGDWIALNESLLPAQKRTLSRMHRRTKLSTREQRDTVPLHVTEVSAIQLEKVRALMNSQTKERFDDVWNQLINPQIPVPKIQPASKTTISQNDIDQLTKCGIIKSVAEERLKMSPTKGTIVPFTTLEYRDEKPRRRFICWPTAHNYALHDAYEAQVPISQPSTYVDAVQYDAAVKRDLRCGFYQIELPEACRCFYRFVYQNNVYELNRMPMGHVCAPEIQQTITAVIAGDSSYCNEHTQNVRFGYPGRIDTYIDGFRFSGTHAACRDYEIWMEKRAKALKATFKDSDSMRGKQYTFVGIDFDHECKKYRLSKSFVQKIPRNIENIILMHELETLTARLVYGASVLRTNLPRYYWVIKYVRRRLSKLNKGQISDTTELSLPPTIYNDLQMWMNEIKANQWQEYVSVSEDEASSAVMYTDASEAGWGGVLFLPTGEVLATGAAWDYKIEINFAEALAVERAFLAFEQHWPKITNIRLMLDNSSVIASLRKEWAESPALAEVLTRLLPFFHEYRLRVTPYYGLGGTFDEYSS